MCGPASASRRTSRNCRAAIRTRILFRSVGGDVELAGMVELFEIRPALTEVVLTLDYETLSPLQKAFEALDRFLNRQLARIEGCMERVRIPRAA